MPSMATLQLLVPIVALAMSIISFGIFLFRSPSDQKISETVSKVADAAKPQQGSGGQQGFAPGSPADLVSIVKAVGELASSLGKLGPSFTSLIASILFLAIAAISTGAIQGKPTADTATAQGGSAADVKKPGS